jgi:hypothetical protein
VCAPAFGADGVPSPKPPDKIVNTRNRIAPVTRPSLDGFRSSITRLKFFPVCFLAVALAVPMAHAQSDTNFSKFRYTITGPSLALHFDLTPDLQNYYILDQATNLLAFAPRQMVYGGDSNAVSFTVLTTASQQMFWRVRRISASAPLDIDGDGINDLYELKHGLNPLNASDASLLSGFSGSTGLPLTWLQEYLYQQTNNVVLYDAVSREISGFNFGQPTANFEAVSREASVFNAPSPDSDYDGVDDAYEINHGLNPADPNDVNQLSGFTDDSGSPLTWLQLYRYYFGQNKTLYDAVSREVSTFNFGQPTANYEAISREVSVQNTP